MHTRRLKALTVLTASCLALVAAAAGACSSAKPGQTQLDVEIFGDMGYRDLYTRYEQSHPGIKIVEHVVSYDDHHKNLQAHLLGGSGTGDIEAIDGGYIAQFRVMADKFVDFRDYGATPGQWLPWKSQQATGANGQLMGLGADVGGLAMCYRRDLFAQAGLPTDRDQVAALWPDWQSYIATGKRFKAGAPDGVAWFDSGSNVFNAIIGQAPVGYTATSNKVVVAENPAVKRAFNLAVEAVQAGESAKLATFSQQWNAGFQRGSFATVACPAWMTDTIKQNAPQTSGKWDIATIPGGSGNWGGSFLTVPKQSKHQKEAAELARYLTAPEQASWIFRTQGHLPSQASLYNDPAVLGNTNAFFNNAPTGQLFTEAAKNLRPQYQGPKDGDIGPLIGLGITRVDKGKQRPAQAWDQVLKDVANATEP
ncbi:ABC transporter substrate-binding protein [Dactylosporangium siamense]|uniref:ABC transporter substrate-binding protein n=1 Tax=Dactylosporangium siamense TaxID=685454 RepID=A0A919PTJ7_9ACTN|nr:ABC transporter substrate-binding protein [Dactylosporangium siamense]GIG49934.1 ABC transporter substrate-binding protein [Dactylosporangium siamense]